MYRNLIVLTHQLLGRACDRASTYANVIPDGPKRQLAEAFAEVLQTVCTEFDAFLKTSPANEDIEQRCYHLTVTVDRFTRLFFTVFERVELPGAVNYLQLPLLRFCPPASHCIGLIPSADEMNFETSMISLRHVWSVLSFDEDKIAAADPTIRFFIRYPHLLSDDALALTVLGHEMAHVWYQELNAADQIAPIVEMDSEALARISTQRNLPPDAAFEFYATLQAIQSAWAEEIVCDIAAVDLLGPSSLSHMKER